MVESVTQEAAERACKDIWEEVEQQAKESGIDLRYLFTKLKEELEAHVTKTFSTTQGIVYSDPMIAWDVRQKARMDAHRLLNHYPAEKKDVKHEGNITVEILKFSGNGHKPKKKAGTRA